MAPLILLMTGACAHLENRDSTPVNNEHMVNAALWQQHSGEARALFYQGYNIARRSLDRLLDEHDGGKPPAIITDLDETALDNSPYQARAILSGKGFPHGWTEWVMEASADALPGAVDFFKYADGLGVAIFYITNRRYDEGEKEPTLDNLRKLGFPQVRPERLMLQSGDESDKESRRAQVAAEYDVLLLLGDQLGDFTSQYDGMTEQRNLVVDADRCLFGARYIAFPNPMYGAFEGAIYREHEAFDEHERCRSRRSFLEQRK